MAHNNAQRDDSYDDEIIALLHQVGQRLIHSESERKELKRVMDDLAEKSDQGERAFLTIQDRISKTESILEKRQRALEKLQQEQEAKLERATAMADKIEEAIAQHARINRRLDKLAQDKARTMRKLERIEEAVIETHEVINGRLLAAPPSTARVTEEQEHEDSFKNWLPQAPAANDSEAEEDRPWWKQHATIRAFAIAAMIAVGMGGGWAVSKIQPGSLHGNRLADIPTGQVVASNEEPPSFDALADYQQQDSTADSSSADADRTAFSQQIEQALADQNTDADTSEETNTAQAADSNTSDETAAVAETETAAVAKPAQPAPKPVEKKVTAKAAEPKQPATEKSPVEMSDEELLANLNNDPDALAQRLNEIAVGAGDAMPENLAKAAPKKQAQAEKVSLTPRQKIKEMTTEDFLNGQRDSRPLSTRIKPDPNLPPIIKEVEKKAFEGVPEAQHDLAAIYTAGHGGVPVDYKRAAAWFKESALQGIANARYNLGVLYHQGLGVEQNINTAVQWYRAAAEMGHPEAEYNLGIAYIEGVGTHYDPEKAAHYFKQAANQGILEAAYNLGLIEENGLTGDARPDEALYWYKKAADMGSPEAKAAMNQLAKTLGMMPGEVEKLYKDKDAKEGGTSASATAAKPPAPPHPPLSGRDQAAGSSNNSRAVEYIEAQPLNPDSDTAPPSLAKVEESSNPAIKQDSALIAQVQEQLIRLGLYPGPADGVADSLTEDAIRTYQTQNNLKADGRVSQALLVNMMTSELGSN